jgi:hypothetical protein
MFHFQQRKKGKVEKVQSPHNQMKIKIILGCSFCLTTRFMKFMKFEFFLQLFEESE